MIGATNGVYGETPIVHDADVIDDAELLEASWLVRGGSAAQLSSGYSGGFRAVTHLSDRS